MLALIFSPFLLGVCFHNAQSTHRADKDSGHLPSCRKRQGQVGAVPFTSNILWSRHRGGNHSPSTHSLSVWAAGTLCKSQCGCSPPGKTVDAPQQVSSICFADKCHTCLFLKGILGLASNPPHIPIFERYHTVGIQSPMEGSLTFKSSRGWFWQIGNCKKYLFW